MEMHLDALFSAVFSTGVTAALAKAFIGKSLRDLEQVSEKITEIRSTLSAISVKLDLMDKERDIILSHDRQIAAMENEIYGGQSRKVSPTGKG